MDPLLQLCCCYRSVGVGARRVSVSECAQSVGGDCAWHPYDQGGQEEQYEGEHTCPPLWYWTVSSCSWSGGIDSTSCSTAPCSTAWELEKRLKGRRALRRS